MITDLVHSNGILGSLELDVGNLLNLRAAAMYRYLTSRKKLNFSFQLVTGIQDSRDSVNRLC